MYRMYWNSGNRGFSSKGGEGEGEVVQWRGGTGVLFQVRGRGTRGVGGVRSVVSGGIEEGEVLELRKRGVG